MKNFFANRRGTLLIGGIVNLVIPSIMVVALLGSPLRSFARPLVTVEQGFKAFCKNYFDGISQKKDLATCRAMSGSFANVLPKDAKSLWPDESLKVLATNNKLGTLNTPNKFRTAWLKQITDQVQRTLIRGDKGFMPTLFGFESSVSVLKPSGSEGNIEERFEEFCDFYYNDEPEEEQEVDVPACKGISVSFAIVVPEDAQDRWPDENLKVLAEDDALDGIETPEDFENALLDEIGDDKDLKILIEQDKDFIPTLFEFELADLDSNS